MLQEQERALCELRSTQREAQAGEIWRGGGGHGGGGGAKPAQQPVANSGRGLPKQTHLFPVLLFSPYPKIKRNQSRK